MGVVDLERLSTALYVIRNLPDRSTDERADEIVRLKPHISRDQACRALVEVGGLLDDASQMVAS